MWCVLNIETLLAFKLGVTDDGKGIRMSRTHTHTTLHTLGKIQVRLEDNFLFEFFSFKKIFKKCRSSFYRQLLLLHMKMMKVKKVSSAFVVKLFESRISSSYNNHRQIHFFVSSHENVCEKIIS